MFYATQGALSKLNLKKYLFKSIGQGKCSGANDEVKDEDRRSGRRKTGSRRHFHLLLFNYHIPSEFCKNSLENVTQAIEKSVFYNSLVSGNLGAS